MNRESGFLISVPFMYIMRSIIHKTDEPCHISNSDQAQQRTLCVISSIKYYVAKIII